MTPAKSSSLFTRFSKWTARATGNPLTFAAAVAIIVIWALTGPIFHWSDTWQLVVNTGTTIVTFLMVFLIQNTQNRDATVFHLKLDELIRAVREARTELVDMEDLSEEQIERLRAQFTRLRKRAEAGGGDETAPGSPGGNPQRGTSVTGRDPA